MGKRRDIYVDALIWEEKFSFAKTMLSTRLRTDGLRFVHDDLVIVYRESGATKAFYDDNEGHVIRYDVNASADKKKTTLISEQAAGAPRYRLIYESLQPGRVKMSEEIAPPD